MPRHWKPVLSAVIGLGIGLAALGAGTTAVQARDGKDPVKVRRAAMKQMGGHMKGVGGFLKGGKRAGTAQTVALRGESIAAIADRIPSLFPKGTGLNDGVGETGAKPEIWQKWPEFQKAAANLGGLARKFAAAAETGDKQAIKTAMGVLGKQGCGGCHKIFRKKLK